MDCSMLLNYHIITYIASLYPSLIYYWHCSIFRNIPGITTFPPCAYLFARLLPTPGRKVRIETAATSQLTLVESTLHA